MAHSPDLPFAQSSENNKEPICEILTRYLKNPQNVLEIASGTGQHAVHFAQALPHVRWQTSDLPDKLSGIEAWCNAYPAENLSKPITVDLLDGNEHLGTFDAVYAANISHITPLAALSGYFRVCHQCLPEGGLAFLYGPFNYDGRYTSAGNQAFDKSLKERNPKWGIRDFSLVDDYARAEGLSLLEDCTMPANNRLLVWRRLGAELDEN